ncbi:MAG TPA: magnesium/cobalt transporter CorA [Hyphomicrobium sp.]|jgi:magnesium transporter|uniref:magnesium/cobalt transporter CorA n=1 Tax=Hyphomicrobium sp. TaxID=82 RepID=UPI002BF8CAF4|nr:magnesium/cobalt transporter CorA [Hyphomicrobium sp.]HXE02167.1 magnesium/cobalt transporter CorA [Hyphomicrobium sp.]
MLRSYTRDNSHLVMVQDAGPANPSTTAASPASAVWLDLYNPAPEDNRYVEQLLSIDLPTREEMQEIEVSARLYQEDGAEFMTITSASLLESDEPITTPITFVLKGNTLVTVRYAEPKAFANFVARAQKPNAVPVATGENIMMGLIEALLDRMADALERVGTEIDAVSRLVFRKGAKDKPGPSSDDLQTSIERIGQNGDLLTKVRESLVSINRVLTYHTSVEQQDKKMTKDAKMRTKILYRDVVALTDQATFLSSKINFLLDATLGLINLQQNQIIKIFSVAAVVFLPPTLVASIYGMNFSEIPELKWVFGYPWALGLMVASAVLPYFYFKRRHWL